MPDPGLDNDVRLKRLKTQRNVCVAAAVVFALALGVAGTVFGIDNSQSAVASHEIMASFANRQAVVSAREQRVARMEMELALRSIPPPELSARSLPLVLQAIGPYSQLDSTSLQNGHALITATTEQPDKIDATLQRLQKAFPGKAMTLTVTAPMHDGLTSELGPDGHPIAVTRYPYQYQIDINPTPPALPAMSPATGSPSLAPPVASNSN